THVAPVLGERMPHLRHGPDAIVRHAVHEYRRAADAIALVPDFLVAHALQFATAALDGALDRVLRHVVGRGLVHGQPQSRIARRIRPAEPRGDCDLLDEAGKYLPALGIL